MWTCALGCSQLQGLTAASHLSLSCLQVPEIVSVLRAKLRDTQEEHVLPAAQHSVYLLASQHCEAVVSSLLGSPLPFDRYSVLSACLVEAILQLWGFPAWHSVCSSSTSPPLLQPKFSA